MTKPTTDILICGAGIAGISAAYFLSVKQGIKDIILVDERDPLSLTSDKSTECYRNWWPGPDNAMVQLMNRSIDLLEDMARQSGNVFNLNRRGYLFLTADLERVEDFKRLGEQAFQFGAGALRIHSEKSNQPEYVPADPEGFESDLDGADLILNTEMIQKHFPYLSTDTLAALHVRRAGWLSAQQLGMYMLREARKNGVRLVNAKVTGIKTIGHGVNEVELAADTDQRISTPTFINAAGPYVKEIGELLDVELPVFSELHLKVACNDPIQVVPRHAPLLIWEDPQKIPFNQEEQQFLVEDPEIQWLLNEFPRGIHTRPEGGSDSQSILILWTYDTKPVKPVWPPPVDPFYPEVVMRGLAAMLPLMQDYYGKFPKPIVDGGYYTKTVENRPLVTPLDIEGAFLIGAFSGFGIMASCACGELLAAHVTGDTLPSYAPSFDLKRYQNPDYIKLLETWGDTGQL
jgi:sarcosine oxidase subunit beta